MVTDGKRLDGTDRERLGPDPPPYPIRHSQPATREWRRTGQTLADAAAPQRGEVPNVQDIMPTIREIAHRAHEPLAPPYWASLIHTIHLSIASHHDVRHG